MFKKNALDNLHMAALKGDLEELARIFETDPQGINRPHTEYQTFPVDFAAQKGHLPALIWLIDHGAIINTPEIMDFVFQSENMELIDYLFENHNEIFNQVPPLHLACCRGDIESVERLLEQGNNIFPCQGNIEMPFTLAIRFEQNKLIHYLVKNLSLDLNVPLIETTYLNTSSILGLVALHKKWDLFKELANYAEKIDLTVITNSKDECFPYSLFYKLCFNQQWDLLLHVKDKAILNLNEATTSTSFREASPASIARHMASLKKLALKSGFDENSFTINIGGGSHTIALLLALDGEWPFLEKIANNNFINLNATFQEHLKHGGMTLFNFMYMKKQFDLLKKLLNPKFPIDLNVQISADNEYKGFTPAYFLCWENQNLLKELAFSSETPLYLDAAPSHKKCAARGISLTSCLITLNQWDLLKDSLNKGAKVTHYFNSLTLQDPHVIFFVTLGTPILNNDLSKLIELLSDPTIAVKNIVHHQHIYFEPQLPPKKRMRIPIHPIYLASALDRLEILNFLLNHELFTLNQNNDSFNKDLIRFVCQFSSKEVITQVLSYILMENAEDFAINCAIENLKIQFDEKNPRLDHFSDLLEFLFCKSKKICSITDKSFKNLLDPKLFISQRKETQSKNICSDIFFKRYGLFYQATKSGQDNTYWYRNIGSDILMGVYEMLINLILKKTVDVPLALSLDMN
jgi:hypothetical protein